MNRNSYQSYSGTYYNGGANKTASSGFGATNAQRSPLYPIGPTLTQPEFKPIQRGTSPYLSRQGLMPPSYDQRHRHQTAAGFNQTAGENRFDMTKINYEDRQKELISRNQTEIEEEHKRREQIRLSYQREIATKSGAQSRNIERKQRLLAQLDTLGATKDDLHARLMDLKPPCNKINTFEPMDRKQQEMIIMKNKLVGQMREKESELNTEEEEEEKFWENQLAQKERILMGMELESNSKRVELSADRNMLEKPDFISVEDQVREERYQDYIFQVSEIESKISRLTQERESLSQEVRQNLTQKKLQTHGLRLKREELAREREEIDLRVRDLERMGKEMEQANSNLFNELDRKENMITKYENGIQQLRDKKRIQETMMTDEFSKAREEDDSEIIPGLAREIVSVQDDLRVQQSSCSRLKSQYHRLYELLCSSTTKNIHQAFGTIYSSEIAS